jgi:hypothetical protein
MIDAMSDSSPDASNDFGYLNYDGSATRSGGSSRKRWILIGVAMALIVTVAFARYRLNEPPIATKEEFMASLPPYSLQLAETNSSSPQAKAIAWTMNHPQYPLYRLKQRYALAVLYYSTNGESWVRDGGWLLNDNECRWGSCGKSFRVSVLSLDHDGFDGYLPTELELLTDLKYMAFYDEHGALSGTIHSELYVSCLATSCRSTSLLLT